MDSSRSLLCSVLLCTFACGPSSSDETSVDAERLVGARAAGDGELNAGRFPIVFTSERAGGYQELFLMSPDGGGRDAVPLALGGEYYLPRWRPDGASISFREVVDGATAEVGLMAPDGTQRVLLTRGEDGGAFGYGPHWSPDGERISFGSIREAGTRVWAVSRLGGTPERLLPELEIEHREAAWSPDGTRVAYSAVIGAGRQRGLFVAEVQNPDGAVRIPTDGVYAPGFLRWSPDGTRIAFSSAVALPDGRPEPGAPATDGGYAAPDDEVFVVEVESGVLTRLTDNAELDLVPAWAPDGQHILYTAERDGDPDLYLAPIDAPDQVRNLTEDDDDPRGDSQADWYWGPR